MKLTDEQIEQSLEGVTQPDITTHLAIHKDSGVAFAECIKRPLHCIDDLREILALRQQIAELESNLKDCRNTIELLRDCLASKN